MVEHYICSSTDVSTNVTTRKRIIYSNGIPDHSIRWNNSNTPQEKLWYIELPADPVYMIGSTVEPPSGGTVAMAINGVPIFGANEAQPDVGNAVRCYTPALICRFSHSRLL